MRYRIAVVDADGLVVYASTIEPPEGVSPSEVMMPAGEHQLILVPDGTDPVIYGDRWNGTEFVAASFDHLDGMHREWAETAAAEARINATV